MKNIVVVAHKFLTQPDDDLVLFLIKEEYANVLHICHSFSDAPDRKSYYAWYKEGQLYKRGHSRDYRLFPEPLLYVKEMFFTILWLFRGGIIWNEYVAMDGLLCLFGRISKYFGRVESVIFWAIDFVPKNRFSSGLKSALYHRVNIAGYTNADQMWDLSPRMAEAREHFLGVSPSIYKKHRVVPYGVWGERIQTFDYNQCNKNTLVFMGHLLEKQGAQLVLNALPAILKSIPDIRFKVIGTGPYKQELIRLAEKYGVSKQCDFLGKIDDITVLEKEIATGAVALAPYIRALDTWTYYADPGKVKTYLACGVPVLLTDVPWNAEEIERSGCGKIIAETPEDIAQKILLLLDPARNQQSRERARQYAMAFDYKKIFRDLL